MVRIGTLIAGLMILCFPLTSQQNQIITAVPYLVLEDMHLADENGNLSIEANESCDLVFSLKNLGEQPARTVKINLMLLHPEGLDVKYRKSKSLGILKPKSVEKVKFPIEGGESLGDGIAEFRIEISEINGFDAAPTNLEIKTTQGSLVKKAAATSIAEVPEPTETANIGLVGLKYTDYNKNDALEAYETSNIEFRIFNYAEDYIKDVFVYLVPKKDNPPGISYPRSTLLGTFTPSEYRDISIPIKGKKNITDGQAAFGVYLMEEGGVESEPLELEITTREYSPPILRIAESEFIGQGGSTVKLGEQFNLRVVLENIGSGTAFNIEVVPRLTNENVKLVDPNTIVEIEEIAGGSSQELSFKLFANRKNIFPEVPVILEITEKFNDLYLDSMLVALIQIPEQKRLEGTYLAPQTENQARETESEEIESTASKVSPPKLELQNVVFLDEDGNDIINYQESCEIKFDISNVGSGPAEGVTVIINQLNNDISALSFQERILLGNLGPQQKVPVNIPIRSTGITVSDVADFSVQVIENAGWDAAPRSIKVKTQKLLEPDLTVASATFKGETGALRPNDDIELNITLKNNGPGDASDIMVQFELPNDPNCFLLGDGKDEFVLKKLKKGETRDFRLSFITNRRYTDDQIPIKLEISESYRKYGLDTVLVGKLTQSTLAVTTIDIQPRIVEPVVGNNESLAEQSLDPIPLNEPVTTTNLPQQTQTEPQNLQVRGGGDPLKGLGYEEAVREMNIGRYFALIIGIDDYNGVWPKLNNAVHDAQSVEMTLRTKYKFDHFETLYNDMATGKNILKKLEWLIENVTEDDNLLIFYSGHGDFKERVNRGYWVPADAETTETFDLISNSEIQDYLDAIKSKHTLLISDACFSGDIFRGETLTIPLVRTERYYRQQHSLPSRRAITSGGIEPVVDGGPEGHSVFSFYLLESLEANQERFYDASQLYTQLKVPVFNNSNQSPVFLPIKNTGDRGGQFIFIRK